MWFSAAAQGPAGPARTLKDVALLKWLVFAAGALMSVAGATWLWRGLDIVQVERGWSGVIAGAVLIGSGGVLMALAAVLRELEALRFGQSAPMSAARRAPEAQASAPPVAPEAARRDEPAAPGLPKAFPPDLGFEPPAAPAEAGGADHWKTILARTSPAQDRPADPVPTRDGRLARRYESQGVRYSLFDDGTIEAETESGRYAFASIEELRAFLDARKAASGG